MDYYMQMLKQKVIQSFRFPGGISDFWILKFIDPQYSYTNIRCFPGVFTMCALTRMRTVFAVLYYCIRPPEQGDQTARSEEEHDGSHDGRIILIFNKK